MGSEALATAMIPLFGQKPMDRATLLIMSESHWELWWPPSHRLQFLNGVLCVSVIVLVILRNLREKETSAGW